MRFFLIGSAAERAGVSAETVRAYCREGLVSPDRDSSGRRLFTEEDVRRIREIREYKAISRRPQPAEETNG